MRKFVLVITISVLTALALLTCLRATGLHEADCAFITGFALWPIDRFWKAFYDDFFK